jgi:hypothetical protein
MNEENGSYRTGYEIRIKGPLDPDFAGQESLFYIQNEKTESGEIIGNLICQIEDQPRLRGILNHLWDLNRTILSVQRIILKEKIGEE